MLKSVIRVLIVLSCLFMAMVVSAQEIETIEKELKTLEQQVKAKDIGEGQLKEALRSLASTRIRLFELLERDTKLIEKSTQDFASLGKPVEKEPAEVTKKRKELEASKKEYEKHSSTIRLLALKVEDIHKVSADHLVAIHRTQLLAHTPDMLELFQEGYAQPGEWLKGLKKVVLQSVGLKPPFRNKLLYIVFLLAVVVVLSLGIRKKMLTWEKKHNWGDSFSDQFACALSVTLFRWLPYLSTSTIFALSFYSIADQLQTTTSYYLLFVYALPVFFSLLALIEFLFVPHVPARVFLVEDGRLANSLASRLRLLLLTLYIAFILFSSSMRDALTDEMFYFARSIFAVLFIGMMVSLSRAVGKIPDVQKLPGIRFLFVLSMLVALISELAGYRNLSTMIFRVSAGILLSFSVLLFLRALVGDIYDGLEAGGRLWQKRLRNFMGIRPGDRVSWLFWMRFLTSIVLWAGFIYSLMQVMGLSESTLQQVYLIIREGFSVGSLKIVPERVFWAIVAFFVLFLFSSWLKVRFERQLVARMRMERGAREAMVTMFGYIGVAIAVIVSLGISGFTFTNLAIIAGALSVGIGFGLQNIVNNFVSGIILLFERPVKTGDWIVVGNTEGYVKKIRIRSTHIQTFDKADVIVPNSDLISNQVINWMLYDQTGRIRVPVGVAYGTDTQKVKEILLDVAKKHPEVIDNSDEYKIRVLFLAFGDSALNFELRCFIRQIDNRLQVISDMNYSIDKVFRENGIEIPFPQRDIHIKGDKISLPAEKSEGEE